ncbi:isochorismate synthase [Actinosynnema mirum DSM 43827]|uniref:isochorismate synthase n=2 Tax=Actinosynnema mirum TaxID=40567 RepID=C6WNZ2_ACTMD|nr:isochorismate synthase [Actinosynnema mirum DSM 43827]
MPPTALVRPRPAHRAADLLAAYLPGSFYFSSARGALLADGVHANVDAPKGRRAHAAARALREAAELGVENPVVVGALGFAAGADSSLVVPAVVRRAEPSSAATTAWAHRTARAAHGSEPGPGSGAEPGTGAGPNGGSASSRAADVGAADSGAARAGTTSAAGGAAHADAMGAAGGTAGGGDPGAVGSSDPGAAGSSDPGAPGSGVPHASRSALPAAPGWTVSPSPSPAAYADAVARALEMIGDGELAKVVVARALDVTAPHRLEVPELLARLVAADPAAHAFAIDVSAPGDAATRTLVGASPELLVSRRGDRVVANPLAGSLPRTGDPVEDARRAAALLASAKDLAEHEHVSAQVAGVLGRFCAELDVPAPVVIATPTMLHLSTTITGRLTDPDDPASSALGLAEALHPTPAVCGVPTERAASAISALEPQERGYYAGLVGWTDLAGDGEWVVTIRCAEVCGDTARLFAGAGVVAGSSPSAEVVETGAKFGTMLRALGLGDVA